MKHLRVWIILLPVMVLAAIPAAAGAQSETVGPAQAIKTQAETGRQSSQIDSVRAAEIRARIRAILARPDFARAAARDAKPETRWIRWLREVWNRFWSGAADSAVQLGETHPWVLYAALLLAALVLLLMTYRVLSASFWERRSAATEGGRKPPPDSNRLFSRAIEAASDGDYAQAVRFLFHSAAVSLFGEAALTTPTYALLLRLNATRSACAAGFARLNHCFSASFYGGAPISCDDYERARRDAIVLRGVREECR